MNNHCKPNGPAMRFTPVLPGGAAHCGRFGLKTMPNYENFKIKEKALNLCFESVPIQWTWFGQCRINNSSQKLNVKFMIFGKKSLKTFFHQ